MTALTKDETIIVEILKEAGAVSQATHLSPKDLVERCVDKGLSDKATIESCVIQLIDHDIIEYEMDENNQANELWLLEE